MSVISRNPFDLLGEDGSEAPAVKAPAQPKKAEAPKPAREVPGSKAPQQANRGRGGYYSRGAPRNVLKTSAEKTSSTDAVEATDPESGFEGERRAPGRNAPRAHGDGRGRGRATRAPRGRGAAAGGAGGTPHERRQDSRKSGHALPDTEKRVASGWGPEEGSAELAAEVEGAVDASKEAAAPDAEATAAATEAPAAEKKVEEEEDNTKSYEEYLAEKAKAAASFAQLEGRQVEGTSDFVGSALKKSDEPEDPFFSGLKKEKPTGQKKETSSKKEKIFIEHEGRFAPPSTGERRGGARGGRGGNRGDRGERPARGTARGGRGGNTQRQAPIAVNDDKAFPALGA